MKHTPQKSLRETTTSPSQTLGQNRGGRVLHIVPLEKIFATQKDITTRGRIVHVDLTLNFKEDVGQWTTAVIRGQGDLFFQVVVFGVDPRLFEKFKQLNGKMVDLVDVAVTWNRNDNELYPFSITFHGPHSKYGRLSDIREAKDDPKILTSNPALDVAFRVSSDRTPTKTGEDTFDDYKKFRCDFCLDGSTKWCSTKGIAHPKLCEDCGLLDCDSVVPFCGVKPAKKHKKDPFTPASI